jgi:hypothetical protein
MPLAVEEDTWEVSGISGVKKLRGQQYYLVQWKDWPEEYTSWEPAANCTGAERLIRVYEEQHKKKRKA